MSIPLRVPAAGRFQAAGGADCRPGRPGGDGDRALLLYFSVLLLMLAAAAVHFMRARPPLPVAEQGAFVPMVRTSQAALEMHPEAEVNAKPS